VRKTTLLVTLLLFSFLAACSEQVTPEQEATLVAEVVEPAEVPATETTEALMAEPAQVPTEDPATKQPATITPEQISLDTQGLPYSWQAVTVPEQPYDESRPPGPKGLPEHIQILFGVSDPVDREPLTPVMYLIPVDAYQEMWEAAGNDSVSNTINAIREIAFTMDRPADSSGLPALPWEEVSGVNDLAVQFDRAVPAGQANETSATQNGYRFIGRWAQDANPVTNENLRYVYQGFTNDGKYLVSFWYPVTSSQIADEPSAEAIEQVNNDVNAYLTSEAEWLDALATTDWEPDLATLDALVASLEIDGMVSAASQE